MSPLRQRMIRELQLQRKSSHTIEAYVTAVRQLAQQYHRSPEQISHDEVRDFFHFLITDRKLAVSSLNQKLAGIRFLYRRVLGQADFDLQIDRKRSGRLPEPLSRSEVERLLEAVNTRGLGMCATGVLMAACLSYGTALGLIAVRALAPAAGVCALLTLSYGIACGLVVIERTANGVATIDEWPDWNWKDWIWAFGQIAALGGQLVLAGWLLSLLTCMPALIVAPLLAGLAFPVALLSALEADTLLMPYSRVVLTTLVSSGGHGCCSTGSRWRCWSPGVL